MSILSFLIFLRLLTDSVQYRASSVSSANLLLPIISLESSFSSKPIAFFLSSFFCLSDSCNFNRLSCMVEVLSVPGGGGDFFSFD